MYQKVWFTWRVAVLLIKLTDVLTLRFSLSKALYWALRTGTLLARKRVAIRKNFYELGIKSWCVSDFQGIECGFDTHKCQYIYSNLLRAETVWNLKDSGLVQTSNFTRDEPSELSWWKLRRLAQLSLSEWVWIVQHALSVCFSRVERLNIVSGTNVNLHMRRTKLIHQRRLSQRTTLT